MKYRAWAFDLLASLSFLKPLVSFILITVFSGSFSDASWMGSTPLALGLTQLLLFFVAGVSILLVRNWSYWVGILAWIVAIPVDFEIWQFFEKSLPAVWFWGNALLSCLAVKWLSHPGLRKAFFEPHIRWWQQKRRYFFDHKCKFQSSGREFSARISDLSLSGLFLATEVEIPIDSIVEVTVPVHGGTILAPGQVVHRRSAPGSSLPTGYGIQFSGLSRSDQASFRSFLDSLQLGGLSKYEEKDFERPTLFQWIWEILRTGNGFYPTPPNPLKTEMRQLTTHHRRLEDSLRELSRRVDDLESNTR